jgi:hypothetical protein
MSADRLDLNELAELLFAAERELAAAKLARDALGDELLRRFETANAELAGAGIPPVLNVSVEGLGRVSYVQASTATTIDAPACAAKLTALGARLRELGGRNVDDAVPERETRRAAHLRMQARF